MGAPPPSQGSRGGGSGLTVSKPMMLKEDEDAAGVGWRLHGVRGPATSRPPGDCFRSRVSRKQRRRRVINTASSPATSTQEDLCVILIFLKVFSAYLL